MKIIDCFPYFNEKELLQLRINLLYDYVDKFIITDADHTHSGNPKPYTCKDTIKELGLPTDKIEVIEVKLPNKHDEPDHWVRERLQRDFAMDFINEDDICIISDCDEIINPNYLEWCISVAKDNPNNILRLPMIFLSGRADLRVYNEFNNPMKWDSSYICMKHHIQKYNLSYIRESFSRGECEIEEYPSILINTHGSIVNMGWHFSWMGDYEKNKKKFQSFAHCDDFDLELLENYKPKENSTDVLGRKSHILKKYRIQNLPKKIFEFPNIKKFLLPNYGDYDIDSILRGNDVAKSTYSEDIDKDFNWGDTTQDQINLIYNENFIQKIYEKHYKVKENDIIIDVGSNYGSFPYNIKESKPKQIYCIEPSEKIFPILKNNLQDLPCTFINKAITDVDKEYNIIDDETYIFHHHNISYSSIKFKTFINQYNIKDIDLLKFDCEGGEYFIFNDENIEYIKKYVKNIAGEYHITPFKKSAENFIKFRNNYLQDLKNTNKLYVYDIKGNDITEEIFDDQYIVNFKDFYEKTNPWQGQIMIYANFENIKTTSIPIIGTAVVNNTYWIKKLIDSVDYPVDNFLIINNNGRGEIDKELDDIVTEEHQYIKNMKVVHMPSNIGVAGAWNLIIKCYMNEPYWIITNDDVSFLPGLLKEIKENIDSNSDLDIIHPARGTFDLGSWDLFLITENAIKKYGLFDENTYPSFCEDDDYTMRMECLPAKKIIGLNNKYLHGDRVIENEDDYLKSASQTIKSEPSISEKMYNVKMLNFDYLTEKWGNWRYTDPNPLPFENQPISTTTYDLEFVRKKHLGF